MTSAKIAAVKIGRPGHRIHGGAVRRRGFDSTNQCGSGCVVDTLHAAVKLNQGARTKRLSEARSSLGDDTGTTLCVAGGMAGIRCGFDGIPPNAGSTPCAAANPSTFVTRLLGP
jgi:hypothetical protein